MTAMTDACEEHAAATHGDARTIARCSECSLPLCVLCRQYRDTDGQAYCQPCADSLREAQTPNWLRATAFFLAASALTVVLAARVPWWLSATYQVIVFVVTKVVWKPKREGLVLVDESPPAAYAPSSTSSGKRVSAALAASLAMTALIVPFVMHQPLWVEMELVLAGWWLLLGALLTTLLYRGSWVRDDHRTIAKGASGDATSGNWSSWGGLEAFADIEALALMLVAGAAVGAAWLVVELLLPFIVLQGYLLISRAVARVTNGRHQAKGELARALGLGAAWSFAYTVPLAGGVVASHFILKR